jgi:ubiquinone/menaquinone biosynthesis C-methylase UbiE
MDLSSRMLRQGLARAARKGIRAEVQVADAMALPYPDGFFDAVIHVGAIQQFGQGKRKAIDEMLRVTREAGTVLIVDENLAEGKKDTWWGRYLTRQNPMFLDPPPIDLVPKKTHPQLKWILGGLCFQILCRKPSGRETGAT